MNTNELKATMLLSLAFFMVSAPNPDAEAITEMTAGFFVPSNDQRLHADELPLPAEQDFMVEDQNGELTITID